MSQDHCGVRIALQCFECMQISSGETQKPMHPSFTKTQLSQFYRERVKMARSVLSLMKGNRQQTSHEHGEQRSNEGPRKRKGQKQRALYMLPSGMRKHMF
jgi:hypothetical protein